MGEGEDRFDIDSSVKCGVVWKFGKVYAFGDIILDEKAAAEATAWKELRRKLFND